MKSEMRVNNPYVNIDQRTKERLFHGTPMVQVKNASPVFAKLAEESHEDFYNYIEWLGLGYDPNFIILSSLHHYYYDIEDLKGIKTVINLRQLNYIKEIKDFLHSIYPILPQKSFFIGSFVDYKNQKMFLSVPHRSRHQADNIENGIASRIPFLNIMFNILDSKTYRYMTKKSASLLLENACLKVLDMTEINGITYFCTQKMNSSSE